MKVADGLKIIENGWIRKPKGFRVRFHQQTETGIDMVYSPPQEDTPLNSDVTAWRYAWKLWQATLDAAKQEAPGALYNITVVDDQDNPTLFYATGKAQIYNPKAIIENENIGDGDG
ncbi:uncharacterized protein Dvar_09820 [Desulfosarcina variabilis str. Montpellier]|uniref:hypothetical protein n=1 Tax=Desulfosarcina variabilis TaxID=2300 RepID=UPI003AFAE42F